jgi:predicted Zn finger-like uncharacterized protein
MVGASTTAHVTQKQEPSDGPAKTPKQENENIEAAIKEQPPVIPASSQSSANAPHDGEKATKKVIKSTCPKCGSAFVFPIDGLPLKPYVNVKCTNCAQVFALILNKTGSSKGKPSPASKKA